MKISSELTPTEKKLYQALTKEVEGVSEEWFENFAVKKNFTKDFLPFYERYTAITPPPDANSSLEKQTNIEDNIAWAIFLLNPSSESDIKKSFLRATPHVHSDKTGGIAAMFLNNLETWLTGNKKTLAAKTRNRIEQNGKDLGLTLFQTYQAAKDILVAAHNTHSKLLEQAFLPANREAYTEKAQLSPGERGLREILSPDKRPLESEWAFRKILVENIKDIQKSFTEPEQKAALELLFEGMPFEAPSKDARRELHKQIVPKVKKRIDFYTSALKDAHRSPLAESFKNKNIETVFDIVAYNAYLQSKSDSEYSAIPAEINALGAIIDELYINLLLEFYATKALKNEALSNDPQEFYSHYSIYGWASEYNPLGEQTTDGISWGFTLKNPTRIQKKFESYPESSTALRRALELIKKLPSLAKKHPELAQTINQKIVEIQAEIARGNKHQDSETSGTYFSKKDITIPMWIEKVFKNPYYYGPISWEIDNNGTYKKAALGKIYEVAAYYAERNEYDQFIELINFLPLNPATKDYIFAEQTILYLEKLISSFITLEAALKA